MGTDARGERDNPLRRVAELFEVVGWNKRLVDLTEEEVVGLIMIAQRIEGLEDVYTEPYLADVFDRIVQNSVRQEPAPIPF
jgi:hypothetical protein